MYSVLLQSHLDLICCQGFSAPYRNSPRPEFANSQDRIVAFMVDCWVVLSVVHMKIFILSTLNSSLLAGQCVGVGPYAGSCKVDGAAFERGSCSDKVCEGSWFLEFLGSCLG